MTIKLTRGDLLRQDVDAIINTVNCVGVMGKGIALQFKQKWPENFKAYERACKLGQVTPGKMFIYDAGGLVRPHFIINFPTKNHWRENSRLEYIENGLRDLIPKLKQLNIKSVALPPLGCGNGGLDWSIVKPIITRAFEAAPEIEVLLFEPKGAPPPREMVNRTTQPKMTPARAAIIRIISIYREMQYALSKIEVQKLVYFLEKAGQPLNLQFEKNQYGPYSDKLRHVLKAMDGHYIEGVGDHAGDAEIMVIPAALEAAEHYLQQVDPEVRSRVDRVASLIEGFETPYGMELLATVHWVATDNPRPASAAEVVAAVHGWNDRKRKMLQREHIELAWKRLCEENWVDCR